VIVDDKGAPVGMIEDGDAVVLFNFRADRMVEISKAFEYPDFDIFDRERYPKVGGWGCADGGVRMGGWWGVGGGGSAGCCSSCLFSGVLWQAQASRAVVALTGRALAQMSAQAECQLRNT
jgi:hypothetical protein